MTSALPADAEWLASYTSAPATDDTGFKADPNAWQNKEYSAYVAEEAGRSDMWPFTICGM